MDNFQYILHQTYKDLVDMQYNSEQPHKKDNFLDIFHMYDQLDFGNIQIDKMINIFELSDLQSRDEYNLKYKI